MRIFLALLLTLSALSAGGIWLLQRNPQALADHYIEQLAASTGLTIHVESVNVVLLPLPSLAVSNADVVGKGWKFTAAYATLRPDFLALLRGELRPRNITLLRPRLTGALPVALPRTFPTNENPDAAPAPSRPNRRMPALLDDLLASFSSADNALIPGRFRLAVSQGELNVTGTDAARLVIDDLQCDIEATAMTRLKGRFSCTAMELQPAGQAASRLEHLSVEGKTDVSAPLRNTPKLSVRGTLLLPDWLARLNFAVKLQADELGWVLGGDLEGDLRKDEVLLPAHLTGTAALHNRQDNSISLENLRLKLGPDDVGMNGTLRLGGPGVFNIDGRLHLYRASLTEWLGFARNLAPGLQVALDEITEGTLDFSMDGNGLRVPHIEVTAAGSRFVGSGGVASWARPEVALDLKADKVNLGRAIPESVGVLPAEPRYGHGPLTPLPGRPVEPGEVGVDYNIRLGADRVDYGPIVINDALVVIKQGMVDTTTRLEDTLLLVDGSLYGGSVKGDTILGGNPNTPYAIRLHLRDVNGDALAHDLAVMPVSGGKLRCDVDIMSQGKELDEFLSKLHGTVTARGEKGRLRPPANVSGKAAPTTMDFKTLDVSLKARTAAWNQGRLGLEGQWSANIADDGMNADLGLNGRIWFSGDGQGGGNMDFQALPGTLDISLSPEKSFQPQGLKARVSGKFSCQAARNQLSVAEGHVNALGADVSGGAQISLGKDGLSWQGKVAAFIPDAEHTLRQMGATPPSLPQALRRVEVDTAFKGDPSSLSLTGFHAKIDKNDFSGSIGLDWRKELAMRFKLTMPQLDLDRYIGTKSAPGKNEKAQPKKKPTESKAWDLRFMRAFNAEGQLQVGLLTLWRLHTQDLHLKARLDKGDLRFESLGAKFYGAPLSARGELRFTKGLSFSNAISVDGFDLAAASRDRGGSAALGGRGSISAEVGADITGSRQVPAHLNGKWRFSVANGFYQARDKDGALKGKPTHFDAAGSSGVLTNGIAKSSDFYLKGRDLKVNGGGWVNLNNDTLDCNFTVNMKNLPDFPMRLYGSLDNSKTSIGAGKLLLNTIGGITQGFVDVLGSVVEGTWKLFR